MHAMWKPKKFKAIYLLATLYVFTLTLPSAISVYWAFGDALLDHANALSLLPKSGFRDLAVVLMLIHQVWKSTFHYIFCCSMLNIHGKAYDSLEIWNGCSSLPSGSHAPPYTLCGRRWSECTIQRALSSVHWPGSQWWFPYGSLQSFSPSSALSTLQSELC